MASFPKTERGLRSRINSYKEAMRRERRKFGCYDDGYGRRYIIFWFYLVLGDVKGGNAYLRWFEKTFEDDGGEPIQKLCAAILLHRSGKEKKAKYYLADLMLSNLHAIPKVLGRESEQYQFRCSSNFEQAEYLEEMPSEVLAAITDLDKEWMRQLYDSLEFRRYKKQYIDIHTDLDRTEGVEKRSPLVRQLRSVLNELKNGCS
jgi:hypothetical protein